MKSKMDELKGFGYRFLGPVIVSFFDEIEKKKNTDAPLFFLAREGYHLQSLFEYYCKTLNKECNTRYLLCSRVFLFKLCLSDVNLIPMTLDHHFKGSLLSLLVRRYGFSGAQINKIINEVKSSKKLLETEISLPSRKDVAIKVLGEVSELFRDELKNKKQLYLNYLEDIDFASATSRVVDIGFSGTIQKILSKLTDSQLIGHYMVTTKNAVNNSQCTFHGHFAEQKEFGEGFSLLDRSLYLESLLTAPHGQVNDIFDEFDGCRFLYSTKTRAQSEFYLIEQVIRGVKEYMDDTIKENLQLSKNFIPEYYSSFVRHPEYFPEDLRNILEVDDHISGFGVLNPVKVFG